MNPLERRCRRRHDTLLALALAFVTAGCRMTPPMERVDLAQPGWSIHRGQALWQPRAGAPELAGQLLIASNGTGEDFIRFSKEPVEIVLARRSGVGWELKMPAFNKSYSGRGQPPRRIGWYQLTDEIYRGTLGSGWHWSGVDHGRWKLTNAKTGERLEGVFSQ